MTPRLPTLLACALLLLSAATAESQGFRGVFARDNRDAIAVGDDGVVYRTLDGGTTWTQRVLSPAVELRHVAARGFTFVIVGEAGSIWRSTDSGGNFTLTTVPGSPLLRALAMPSDQVWYAGGSGGKLLKTVNAGGTWSPLTSGTLNTINALRFTDELHGWACGDAGTLLVTHDGGGSWAPVSLGTSDRLLSVDQQGTTVWVVGNNGTARRSINGGASFNPVNLKLDARADVRVVHMRSPDSLWIAGGGGFIRFSANGGDTWTFARHSMHQQIVDLSSAAGLVVACNGENRVVLASTDIGANWHFPTGASLSRSWSLRYDFSGTVRGSTMALNPVYKSTIYCALGTNVMRSRDDGDSWSVAATFPSGYSKCNAFLVSPYDSSLWLAAISGSSVSDRVYRSTNSGANWTPTLTFDQGEYGIPLEMDPDHPDTVWFGGENGASGTPQAALRRSHDFGQTWDPMGNVTFRSPCDLIVFPDTTNLMLIADGVTGTGRGRHLRSTNGGSTFSVTDSVSSSEIPGLACSRLAPGLVVGTCWSSGGVQRSTNYGQSWTTAVSTSQAWGIDISRDDPNVVMFAQWSASPTLGWVSLDGGQTYTSVPDYGDGFGRNNGVFVRDRATFLAQNSTGIFKLQNDYSYTPSSGAQSIGVVSPNGGESWTSSSVHSITWNAASVALARVEFRRAPGEAWQWVADVPGYLGSWSWTVPVQGTTQGKVRVTDVWDGAPSDTSNSAFTITVSALDVEPASETTFALLQNHPNPFGGGTDIGFSLARPSDVLLEVFDLRGRRVATLASGRWSAGVHHVSFGASRGPAAGTPGAGVYFYRLTVGKYQVTRRMVRLP